MEVVLNLRGFEEVAEKPSRPWREKRVVPAVSNGGSQWPSPSIPQRPVGGGERGGACGEGAGAGHRERERKQERLFYESESKSESESESESESKSESKSESGAKGDRPCKSESKSESGAKGDRPCRAHALYLVSRPQRRSTCSR